MTHPSGVVVRILGTIEVLDAHGATIRVPSAAQRRLLAVLAVHAPRPVRSDRLAEILEVTPGALRTTVARLRSRLPANTLMTTNGAYGLACGVDSSSFRAALARSGSSVGRPEDLDDALALWAGPPLEEFADEGWAAGEVGELAELHAGALDDRAAALIAARRPVDAVALLERSIHDNPLRARSRDLLIRALALAGRRSDALRAFQAYRSMLVEELGVEPSAEVRETERRVAQGWDGVDDDTPGTPRGTIGIPLPAGLAPHAALVGRDTELATLAEELARVPSGGLGVVVVSGEPGIGKTTLLGEFAARVHARDEALVVYGRCRPHDAPFEPLRTILATCVEYAPLGVLGEHVGHCAGELSRLCPGLRTRLGTIPDPARSDDVTERFLTFDAAADLIRRLSSRRTTVVLIDDLHRAAPTASAMLDHLVRALADAPVLLVVTRGAGDGTPVAEVDTLISDLGQCGARFIEMTGLDDAALEGLVRGAAGGRLPAGFGDVVVTLRENTAGNPLYATHLVRHWMETGALSPAAGEAGAPPLFDGVPPSLRDVLRVRVGALGSVAAGVLESASVLGLEFDVTVLTDLCGLGEGMIVTALDAAVRAGLVVDIPALRPRMRFAHALVANALYAEIGPAKRAQLHQRAVRILAQRDAGAPEAAVQLARHGALSRRPADALRWSIRAGDDALEQLASAEAARHYGTALETLDALNHSGRDRADLLVRLGRAQRRAGDPAAFGTLARAAEAARTSANHEALIEAVLAADRGFMYVGGNAAEYLRLVEAAVTVAGPSDLATRARLLALLAQSLVYTAQAARRVALAREAWTIAAGSGDDRLTAAIAPAVLAALWTPGSGRLRSAIAARAVRSAELTGDPRLLFSTHHAAYNVAVEAADPESAARSLAVLRATVRDVGEPHLVWVATLCDTFDAMMAGRLVDAEAAGLRALDLGVRIGAPDAFTLFAAQYFVIGTFAGKHAGLLPLVEQAMASNPDALPFRLAYAIVCAAIGRTDEARRILRAGITAGFDGLALDNVWMTSIIGYAVLAVELADADAAARLLPIIRPYAADVAFSGVTSQGPVAGYVGKLASLLGEHDEAFTNLRSALWTATAFGWTYHRATTLYALAQARWRASGALDGEAREWLGEAHAMCRELGFTSWLPRIEALLARAQS